MTDPKQARALIEEGRRAMDDRGTVDYDWFDDNGPTLLDALAAAQDEVERLRALAAERYEEAEEVHALAGDAVQTPRPTIAALRAEVERLRSRIDDWAQISKGTLDAHDAVAAELAEAKRVIEQQDRDLERMHRAMTGMRDNLLDWPNTTPVNLARANLLAWIDDAMAGKAGTGRPSIAEVRAKHGMPELSEDERRDNLDAILSNPPRESR